jgi:tight adherence protein B
MLLPLLVFGFTAAIVVGAYVAIVSGSSRDAKRQMELRLRELAPIGATGDDSVVARRAAGPLPHIDQLLSKSAIGSALGRLIEQSGVRTTPSFIVIASLGAGGVAAFLTVLFIRLPLLPIIAAAAAMCTPVMWLMRQRTIRRQRFEEQFPEALDLMSRAVRAGHAFQTALGMVAEELKAPVGPEFKKTFDQQNFGLPLNDALMDLAVRMPLMDVRFFITAVAIQRETGGNLAEILDNLSSVVRERFKIHRQVQVHTAHGRMTGYVLVALPAFLGIALSLVNNEHMNVLFRERMGQMMIVGALVMQIAGYFWIRRVIRIEV